MGEMGLAGKAGDSTVANPLANWQASNVARQQPNQEIGCSTCIILTHS
jgi:hypothetical protein